MNLTKKQKKQIISCLILAVAGDTISFFLGSNKHNSLNKKNSKNKIRLISKLYAIDNLNISGWFHSFYSVWLYAIPQPPENLIFKDNKYYIKKNKYKSQFTFLDMKNIVKVSHRIKPSDRITKTPAIAQLYVSLTNTNLYKLAVHQKTPIRFYARYYDKSNIQKNIKKIETNKIILSPSDDVILFGIPCGLLYLNEKDFYKRDDYIKYIILTTYKHPYSYMCVILLANLISNIFKTGKLIDSIIISNNYLLNKFNHTNKTEKLFCKEFNKFVNKTIYLKKNIVKPLSGYFKKLNPLTTILIAINSLYMAPDKWDLLVNKSGLDYQGNPASCAIACAIYGLLHNFKGVPKSQYNNIENKKNLYTNFFKHGHIKYLPINSY